VFTTNNILCRFSTQQESFNDLEEFYWIVRVCTLEIMQVMNHVLQW